MSPWPLFFSSSMLFLCMNLIHSLFLKFNIIIMMNLMLILLIMFFWFYDVTFESYIMGLHNKYIVSITIYSMIMFIVSEIFFFVSFFWTFFHFMFSPDIENGSMWPYSGIMEINFLSLPLLNSILLISSGCSVTWSHYSLMFNRVKNSKVSLVITIILGTMFIMCQLFEYYMSNFSFSDGIFGSIFFIATGFHGIHVLIGSLFLLFMMLRMSNNHFSYKHMLGYEFSIWYWHFVDLVWLYLYMMVYWLGSI